MARGAATAEGRKQERRHRHHGVSRDQLLDAAEEVFGRKGFEKATLREVAELAEFSVGSVYSFFDGKDDLFRNIFLRRGEQFMAELHAVVDDRTVDPVEQLHAVIDLEIGFFRRHPSFGRIYLRHSNATMLNTERDIDMLVRDRYEEAMRLQAAVLERGQRLGTFRMGDPEVLARLFSGLISAYQAVDPQVVDGAPKAHERYPLDQLHDVVESAFATRPPPPSKRRGRDK